MATPLTSFAKRNLAAAQSFERFGQSGKYPQQDFPHFHIQSL